MLNSYIKLYIQADKNSIVIKFHNCKSVLDKLNYKQSNAIENLIYLILFLALKYMIAMIV
ncbi:hypothetical protein MICAER10613_008890 [Microcystis aeruginosa]